MGSDGNHIWHLQNSNASGENRKLINKIRRLHSLFWYNKLGIQKPQTGSLAQNENENGSENVDNYTQTESLFQLLKIAFSQVKSEKTACCAIHCALNKAEQHNNPAHHIVNAKIANT
ncbi:hypothetical protein R83H12_01807 [Fibrobacteria bacterium R8-3-H12]